jgi:hypothetical protein
VNIEFPKIEVRYEDLTVDAYVHVGSRALPTIPNFICNMTEVSAPSSPKSQKKNAIHIETLTFVSFNEFKGVSAAPEDLPRRARQAAGSG